MSGSVIIVQPDGGELFHRAEEAELLMSLGRFVLHDSLPDSEDELISRVREADALIIDLAQITAGVMDACPKLKLVSFIGVGVWSCVDVPAATNRGIAVANTPGYGSDAVAEHGLALILAAGRRLVEADRGIRRDGWATGLVGMELRGKTLGIVGLGSIGSRLAEIGRGLGMEVIVHTRNPSAKRASEHGVEFVELDELLERSHVVSLHAAQTKETEGLIGAAELKKMRPEAIFINTARAALVDDVALVRALNEGWIAGAGIDVFESEPPPADNPLFDLDNVVLSPHIAYNTAEARERLKRMVQENIVNFFQGQPCNIVNPEVLER
ncbi:2-hydroxyacid dehydrogenase [candidate division KSB1 bacterium]